MLDDGLETRTTDASALASAAKDSHFKKLRIDTNASYSLLPRAVCAWVA